MMAFTHTATGVFIGAAAALLSKASLSSTFLLLLGGLFGSLLPDLDHPKSWLGRRIPFISIPLSALVGHRGVTHSLFAIVATLVGAYAGIAKWGGASAPLLLGVSIGYASHLLGDWASNSGIPLMWPKKRRYKSPIPFFTGSWEEKVLAYAMWIASFILTYHAIL